MAGLRFQIFARIPGPPFLDFRANKLLASPMAERESFSDGEASEDPLDSPGRHSAGSQNSFDINHTDSAESVNVNHVHSELQRVIPKVAESIAEMEVTNPEVLRVAPAFSAFQNLAVALRVGCDGDFYYKSQKSEKISTFWSHSWHGGQWKKILTLLTFYNGPAAILFAFVIATLMMILFVSGYLPSLDRGFWELYFSVWCLPCGFVVATMVMLLWRSQTKVFLEPQHQPSFTILVFCQSRSIRFQQEKHGGFNVQRHPLKSDLNQKKERLKGQKCTPPHS